MTAGNRAAPRDADPLRDRGDEPPLRGSAGEMALQSNRGFEAVPQMFVRLTGSHLAKPGDRL
ncbi:hypothetical protein EDE08_1107 [Bradyrhizobium sp. R2.2-H]|nr:MULTISPECIES: hypothetical protein [unclassified Bradyrhizobium]TCU67447.1 hypothetical protein EDE10_110272 [Bradyrhizobium sp. Y-H1]TCU68986.1 hypothetical protein EDE08_1107 [Bradyrhizobium sp. R2.2-H]